MVLALAPIPLAEITDENPRLNIVNFTASPKKAVAQWHTPLISVSNHHLVQVTRTQQKVRGASADSLADSTLTGLQQLWSLVFSSRTAGGRTATGAARSGSAFTIDCQGEELDYAMHDTGKMKERRRRCS